MFDHWVVVPFYAALLFNNAFESMMLKDFRSMLMDESARSLWARRRFMMDQVYTLDHFYFSQSESTNSGAIWGWRCPVLQAAVPTLVARPHCRTQDASHLFTFLIQLFINSYNLILNMDIFPLRVIEHEDGNYHILRLTIMLAFLASFIGFHANPGTPSWSASRNPHGWQALC